MGHQPYGNDLLALRQQQESHADKQAELAEIPDAESEYQTLLESKGIIGEETGIKEIHVWKAEDPKKHDPQRKAVHAKPMKPAIFVE